MRFKFDKPVGSHADTKELEYISCLMQTCRPIRQDGSLEVEDVFCLLMSRYGVEVQTDSIRNDLFVELAGELDGVPKFVVDIRQVAAMLMIPHLAKLAQGVYVKSVTKGDSDDDTLRHKEGEGAPISIDDSTLEKLVNEIMADVAEGGLSGPNNEPVVTKDLLRKIFEAHDEVTVSDEVLEDMIKAIGGEGKRLNAKTFLKAMTRDLKAWDVNWETKLSTAYTDVMHLDAMNQEVEDLEAADDSKLASSKTSKSGSVQYSMHSQHTQRPKMNDSFSKKARGVFTYSEIDNTADTYGSEAFMVFQWGAFICTYIGIVFSTGSGGAQVECDNISGFGCQVSNAIINWFAIMAQLIALGGIFFLVGSLGNTIFLTKGIVSLIKVLASMAIIFIFTIYFYFDTSISIWLVDTTVENQNVLFMLFNGAALGIGCLLLVMQLHTLARLLIPSSWIENTKLLSKWLLPGAVPKEVRTKKAAAFKTNRMVDNAMSLHLNSEELSTHKSLRSSGFMSGNTHALTIYHAKNFERETTGGVVWGWREFFSGRICYEEGVFFHARLIASVVAQILLTLLIITAFILALFWIDNIYAQAEQSNSIYWTVNDTNLTDANVENSTAWLNDTGVPLFAQDLLRQEINDTLTSVFAGTGVVVDDALIDNFYSTFSDELYNSTGVDFTSAVELAGSVSTVYYDDVLYDDAYYGTDWTWLTDSVAKSDLYVGISCGFVVSFLAIFLAAFNYIPSFIMNVLKFRYGFIGSLDDAEFQRYKEGPDHPTLVFGIAFWSQLYTAGLAFVAAGALGFFISWNESSAFVLFIVANIIGIMVTLIPKIICILVFRGFAFAGFYRKKVAFANVVFVLFECWNVAITVGFLLLRTVFLFLLAIFYIGRIDTPFLANEVDKFDFLSNAAYIDRAPVYYRKDLLLHEAHRHPYIERLGALFLLKLNYGKQFGTRGGSAWRLLYVLTLMPWLKKYRASIRQMNYSTMGDFGNALSSGQTKTVGPSDGGEVGISEQPIPPKKKLSKKKKNSTTSTADNDVNGSFDPSSSSSQKRKKKKDKGPSLAAYDSSDFVAKAP